MTNTKTAEVIAVDLLEEGNFFDGRTFDSLTCLENVYREKSFVRCKFNSCNFAGTLFIEFSFVDCQFVDCRFEGCEFVSGVIQHSQFQRCTILSIEFCTGSRREVDHGFDSVVFHETLLKNSDIGGLLKNVDFTGSTLENNDFVWASPDGKIVPPFDVDPFPNMGAQILEIVRDRGVAESLDMSCWHGKGDECGTTHCLAGWSIILHPQGKALEQMFTSHIAGCILFPEASKYFFVNEEDALEFLETFDG